MTFSITQDLDILPQVAIRHAPSPQDFQAIVAAESPVIIKGALEHWPALSAGRQSAAQINAYFREMDVGASTLVVEAPPSTDGWCFYTPDLHEFNFSKRQGRVSDTLDQMESRSGDPQAPFLAIQMLPLASHLPEFVRQNTLPLLPQTVLPRLWAGGPLRTQTHNDPDHNLACVIRGRRRFLLFPPEQVSNLYIGPMENPPPLSLVNPENPDFERFPKFHQALAAARVAHLEPGDAVFVPKYWWHHVTSLAPYNVMINYWWGDTATGLERTSDCFLTALLAFKDLPAGERAYWKAMFDSYVFHVQGDAVAHLPAALQGPLGKMNATLRAKLKQQLKMTYLKS